MASQTYLHHLVLVRAHDELAHAFSGLLCVLCVPEADELLLEGLASKFLYDGFVVGWEKGGRVVSNSSRGVLAAGGNGEGGWFKKNGVFFSKSRQKLEFFYRNPNFGQSQPSAVSFFFFFVSYQRFVLACMTLRERSVDVLDVLHFLREEVLVVLVPLPAVCPLVFLSKAEDRLQKRGVKRGVTKYAWHILF